MKELIIICSTVTVCFVSVLSVVALYICKGRRVKITHHVEIEV